MRKEFFNVNTFVVKLLCIIPGLLCLAYILFRFFPGILPDNQGNYITNTMDSITEINNSSKTFLDNSSLNVQTALEIIPKMKTDLMNISIDINTNERANEVKVKESFDILSKGLSENILVLEQIEGMLQNPYGTDISLAADNLKIYRDTADSYYSLLSFNNENYNLGTPLYAAINATLDYCISTNNAKKISELKVLESNLFLETLNELTISIDSLLVNYYNRVLDCRSSKITYELLISEIDTCSSKVQSVKDVLSQVTVPDNFDGIYKDFSEIVNLYSDYLYNIKYNVATEKVRRKSKDISEDFMDSLYESTNKSFKEIEEKYKNFTKVYNKLNRNY